MPKTTRARPNIRAPRQSAPRAGASGTNAAGAGSQTSGAPRSECGAGCSEDGRPLAVSTLRRAAFPENSSTFCGHRRILTRHPSRKRDRTSTARSARFRGLRARAGHPARSRPAGSTQKEKYVQEPRLEEGNQEGAAEVRQGKAPGQTRRQGRLGQRPANRAAAVPRNYLRKKGECALCSPPFPRRWRLVIALDDSSWWIFR